MSLVFWFGALVFFSYYLFLKYGVKGVIDESFHFGLLHVILSFLIFSLAPIMYISNNPLSFVEIMLKSVIGFLFLFFGFWHLIVPK